MAMRRTQGRIRMMSECRKSGSCRTLWFVLVVAVVGMGVAQPGWADETTAPASASAQPQAPTQAVSEPSTGQAIPATSGEIIGYQPIPNSVLAGIAASNAAAVASPAAQEGQAAATRTRVPTDFPPPPTTYDPMTWFVGQGPYTLGRDDVIRIQVRNQPDFSGDFIIDPEGSIQYNYLSDIKVLGMTKTEVEQLLTQRLEQYIRAPQVSVVILQYNSKAVYVVGEVARPGKYIMRGDVIKLREAIVASGLPTRTAALGRTHVVKPDLDHPRIRKINLKKILYKGRLKDDIDLYPGEIVVVPSTVLASINNFLSQLLNPFTRATAAAAVGAAL
ncbi:MAG: polysaccharide export protein [Candidatus Omnitrophica bacterium]|nr:polysaccharide export protein [Candidatus Omnitrophota bacterium]